MMYGSQIKIIDNYKESFSHEIPAVLPSDAPEKTETGVYQFTEEITSLALYTPDFRRDALYPEILEHLQKGNWQQSLFLLRVLQAQYPKAKEIEFMMQDAMLKSSIEENWSDKIKARRFAFTPSRILLRVAPVVLLFFLILGGVTYYGANQRVNAQAMERQAQLALAQTAVVEGHYEDAIATLQNLLETYPGDATIQNLLTDAQNQQDIANAYELGHRAMDAGNNSVALEYFLAIDNKTPGYRDVAQLIAQLQSTESASELFAAAETAYRAQQWVEAIDHYENLRILDGAYQAETTKLHLAEAYVQSGLHNVSIRPEQGADVELAQTSFRKALRLNPSENIAKIENELVTAYTNGEQALTANDSLQAVGLLKQIYQARPQYLGGFLGEQLYSSYLELGKQAQETGDYSKALEWYSLATVLQVKDVSEALERTQAVAILLTPTATPTIPPTPAPTATPVPLTMADFSGWIAFRSTRGYGSSIWVMRPDGSDVQPAPSDALEKIQDIYNQQMWSPDGNSRLLVKKQANVNTPNINIYKIREDLPTNWQREFIMTDFPGTEYDPVWAPDNKHIAFVSNHTGNDEIWLMDTEGGEYKQLTWNSWEWDKHPTWSPDGAQIAFFSNRSGLRSIWIMNADGSEQFNLSSVSTSEYEDWDPVWIR
ncbi:MAG: PD40 domain-containing protein [Caldilineaceae bacterium]|nr:PD40 domain-containing protein [Caldilineaceae bacterium]